MPFQSSSARFGLGRVVLQRLSIDPGSGLFVTNYDTTGNIQWVARITGGTTFGGIAVDNSQNVYVIGGFTGTTLTFFNANGTTFGTLTNGSSTSSSDVFVAKYKSNGTVEWTARMGSTATVDDLGSSIAIDSSGNVYVTGYYVSSPLDVFNAGGGSGASLTFDGVSDCFIVKYDTSGIVQWATRIGGTSQENGNGIAVDSSGNVYVTGFYSASARVYNLNGTTYATLSGTGGFIVKYDTSGAPQWVVRITGAGGEVGNAIDVDSSGNVYVTGNFSSATATFLNANGTTAGTLSAVGNNDTFFVKYNTSGANQWIARIAGTGSESGNAIAVDISGNVYVTGTYSSDVSIYNSSGPSFGSFAFTGTGDECFIAKYNTSGTVQWTSRISGSLVERGRGISVDDSGNVYVAGMFTSGTTTILNASGSTFATLNFGGSSGSDGFMVKYDTSGVGQWVARVSGNGSESFGPIAVTGSGNVYAYGTYSSQLGSIPTLYSAGF